MICTDYKVIFVIFRYWYSEGRKKIMGSMDLRNSLLNMSEVSNVSISKT